jgi:hypothetical protein
MLLILWLAYSFVHYNNICTIAIINGRFYLTGGRGHVFHRISMRWMKWGTTSGAFGDGWILDKLRRNFLRFGMVYYLLLWCIMVVEMYVFKRCYGCHHLWTW